MQTFNRIIGTVFVALVASLLVLTAASFIGVRAAEEAPLLAGSCQDATEQVVYAGMSAEHC